MEIEELIPALLNTVSEGDANEDAKFVCVAARIHNTPFTQSLERENFNEILYPILQQVGVKGVPSKRKLSIAYKKFLAQNPSIPVNRELQNYLVHKSVRSASGILNVSISLPPDRFSCKYNCYFCPNEPGMPRSYLSNEAVFKRASQVGFNTVLQVYKRLQDLEKSGHTIDKIEFRVLGGTFSCYDHAVADEFIRDLYYGANTYFLRDSGLPMRAPGTIEEEQTLNVTAQAHVVGLGIETRPDEIKPAEILRFRRYGITRVEIGVQTTHDDILRRVNRGHLTRHSKAAIKLLKDYGFKVEIHIMPDLPGATPELDKECYREVLQGEDLIPDYMKDYPCLDVDFSLLKTWKATGKWKPYAEATDDARDLKDVLIYRQAITPKWVRVNRIHRDFQEAGPGCIGFSSESIKTNMAQIVRNEAEARGIFCQCIRCVELRHEAFDPTAIRYESSEFKASGAQEFFLSAEIKTSKGAGRLLLGFLRLRLSDALVDSIIPELKGKVAMIRELHVYGTMKAVGSAGSSGGGAQHIGIGRTLLRMAEECAIARGFTKMAIISGIGVRGYYMKQGYSLEGSYMVKQLSASAVIEKKGGMMNEGSRDMVLDIGWDIILMCILGLMTWILKQPTAAAGGYGERWNGAGGAQ